MWKKLSHKVLDHNCNWYVYIKNYTEVTSLAPGINVRMLTTMEWQIWTLYRQINLQINSVVNHTSLFLQFGRYLKWRFTLQERNMQRGTIMALMALVVVTTGVKSGMTGQYGKQQKSMPQERSLTYFLDKLPTSKYIVAIVSFQCSVLFRKYAPRSSTKCCRLFLIPFSLFFQNLEIRPCFWLKFCFFIQ